MKAKIYFDIIIQFIFIRFQLIQIRLQRTVGTHRSFVEIDCTRPVKKLIQGCGSRFFIQSLHYRIQDY